MHIFGAKSCIYLLSYGNANPIFYRKNIFEYLAENGRKNPTIFVRLYLPS